MAILCKAATLRSMDASSADRPMILWRKAAPRLVVLAAWVVGLALETAIQIHVTGVRPYPDQRPQQVLAMMCVLGAIALIVRRRDARFRWTTIGAVVGVGLTVALALAGESSPPKAGLIMLHATWLGAAIDHRNA